MAKILIQDGHYAFDSGAKTITFIDYATIDINGVLLITNVTHGVIIYQFDKPTLLGTVITNVLTLTYDSSWMSDTDDLQIWYWDSAIGDSATVENFPATYPLPGSQITTLTPPAAITGYATETTLSALNAKVPASPATSTKQSDGSQKTQIVDGSGNVIGSTGNAVDINIKSGNPTSITANAGTNLNTSALATEAGNLATIKTNTDKLDVALSTRLKPSDTLTKVTTVDTITNVVTVNGTVTANTGLTQPLTDTQLRASSVPVDTELITKDYDSGAGTDTVAAIGILLPKSGGSVAGGTATDPLRTDPTGTTTQPVSGTVTANAGTNLNTSALATEAGNLATIAGKDFATSAKQDTLSTRTGDVTETAPATDTASSGLNGRLQRIAQRVTTLISSILTVKTDQTTHGTTDLVAADVTKIAGTAIDANSGTKSAGTQRIVIATDQPQLTNALRIDGSATTQPVSGTFWQATQPVSVAAAVHVDDNSGSLTVDAPVGTPVYTRLSDGSAALVGQKTMANSLPVSIASDQTSLDVKTFEVTGTGGALNDTPIVATDVRQYKSVSVQVTGTFSQTLIFEGSNDNSNWVAQSDIIKLNNSISNVPASSITAIGIYYVNIKTRYFRVKVSAYTSGTSTCTAEFYAYSINLPVIRTLPYTTATENYLGISLEQIQGVTPDIGSGNPGGTTLRVAVAATAHDGVDVGNPVKIGAKAVTSLKTTTLVSNADRTDAQSDLDGAIIVRQQFPLGDLISERVTDTGGTSTAFSNFTAVASTSNYITAIAVHNSSATNGTVDFRNGTAGSVLWTMRIPANNGSEMTCGGVPLFKTSANTALAYDVSGALSTVSISVSGFQSKV